MSCPNASLKPASLLKYEADMDILYFTEKIPKFPIVLISAALSVDLLF